MASAMVGRWGRNLAIRIPQGLAQSIGLAEGNTVDIEASDGELIVRRPAGDATMRHQAEQAAAEIIADSRRYSLGDVGIRELLEEGRRG